MCITRRSKLREAETALTELTTSLIESYRQDAKERDRIPPHRHDKERYLRSERRCDNLGEAVLLLQRAAELVEAAME